MPDLKTPRPSALPVRLEGIPEALKAKARWMLWKHTWSDGAWRKAPKSVDNTAGSSTNPDKWTTYERAVEAYLTGKYDGLGYALGDEKGIDLDDCIDPFTDELSTLALDTLRDIDGYAEVSPSGTGLKLFTRGELDRSRKDDSKGIEIYGGGRYFTVTGHQVNGHEQLPAVDQPLGAFVLKHFGEQIRVPAVSGDDDGSALAFYKTPLTGWTLERVQEELLSHLDPDCGYDEWMQVGMALHHQGEGAGEWLDAWDSWSQDSGKYHEGYCDSKWESFSEQRFSGTGAVTLASLLHLTKVDRKKDVVNVRDALVAQITAATSEEDLRGAVLPEIMLRKDVLTKADFSVIALTVQTKMRAFTGVRVPISLARQLLREAGRPAGEVVDRTEAPFWAQPFVYVTNGDTFLNTETKEGMTRQGFDTSFNRFMFPFMNEDGIVPMASRHAADVWHIECVANVAYNPTLPRTFELGGLMYANTYSDANVPTVPPALTDSEEAAMRRILEHIKRILPDPREAHLFTDWLAHNVKYPGRKIRWSPFMFGTPGAGKSFFHNLLAAAMGPDNVRPLAAETLIKSPFNEWANGSAIVTIEEIKVPDTSARETDSKLKPLITNDTVEIHPKRAKSYPVINVTNYLLFSNYADGLPLTEDDRRYMALKAAPSRAETVALSESGYFVELFGALEKNSGAVRKLLLEWEFCPEFDPNGHAPWTTIKGKVVELCKSDTHNALEDLIRDGHHGVTSKVISTAHLSAAIKEKTGEPVYTRTLQKLLTNAGYEFFCRVKWEGDARRVWVKDSAIGEFSGPDEERNKKIRAALDASDFTEDFLK